MAILMVLLYHSILVFPINLHDIAWCSNLHTLLWYAQMPLFFLVSGFCYSYNGNYGSYLWKKTKRIMIPHLIFGMADMALRVLPSYIPELQSMVNQKVELSDALMQFAFYAGEDPFLRSLFLLSIVFPAVARIMNKGKAGTIVVFVFSVLIFVFRHRITGVMCLNYAASFMIYYVLGYWIRKKDFAAFQKKLLKPETLWIGVGMLAVGSTMICMGILKGETLPLGMISGEEIWGVAVALGTALTGYRLCVYSKGSVDRIFTRAGECSIVMYLLCGYALVVSRMIIVGKLGITTPILVILFNFIADFVGLWFISRYIIARCRVFSFMCGMKYVTKKK